MINVRLNSLFYKLIYKFVFVCLSARFYVSSLFERIKSCPILNLKISLSFLEAQAVSFKLLTARATL